MPPKIVLFGRYLSKDSLPGPYKVTNRILFNLTKLSKETVLIEYFFKEKKIRGIYSLLFGSLTISENPKVKRLGIVKIILFLYKYRPDIIHILNSEKFIIPLFLIKFLYKAKWVTTKHSILKYDYKVNPSKLLKWGGKKNLLFEYLEFRFVDTFLFYSEEQIKLASNYYSLGNKEKFIISNGIDDDFYYSSKEKVDQDSIKLVFYNGFDDSLNRGLSYVVDSLNKIDPSYKFKLYVLGNIDRNLLTNAHFIYEVFPILNRIRLLEFLKNKDIILKADRLDSFPIFLIESMAMGIIPVISDKVGLKRYIKHKINGLIYNSSEMDGLYSTLMYMFTNKSEITKMSENSRKIYNDLKWENIAKSYFEIYKKITLV